MTGKTYLSACVEDSNKSGRFVFVLLVQKPGTRSLSIFTLTSQRGWENTVLKAGPFVATVKGNLDKAKSYSLARKGCFFSTDTLLTYGKRSNIKGCTAKLVSDDFWETEALAIRDTIFKRCTASHTIDVPKYMLATVFTLKLSFIKSLRTKPLHVRIKPLTQAGDQPSGSSHDEQDNSRGETMGSDDDDGQDEDGHEETEDEDGGEEAEDRDGDVEEHEMDEENVEEGQDGEEGEHSEHPTPEAQHVHDQTRTEQTVDQSPANEYTNSIPKITDKPPTTGNKKASNRRIPDHPAKRTRGGPQHTIPEIVQPC